MAKNPHTSALVDGVLKILIFGSTVAIGAVVPNLLQVVDKPLQKKLKQLDNQSRKREFDRVIKYMKSQGLIHIENQHGLRISEKGRRRIESLDFESLRIERPSQWDQTWRLILYDIPEKYRKERFHFSSKLKELGFYKIQKSVWVIPYPCKEEIRNIAANYRIEKYVSYLETQHIENQTILKDRFSI